MLKDISFQQKFSILKEWVPTLIHSIRRELKNEHLKSDLSFYKKYFSNRPLAKISEEELASAYGKAIEEEERGEQLAEFMAQRWIAKHTDIYHFFSEELHKIAPDFVALEAIDDETAKIIKEKAVAAFGAIDTYLFCFLNSVVFSEAIYQELGQQASLELTSKSEENLGITNENPEQLKNRFEQQIRRLTDNYEKKLLGWQKKYFTDIDQLKKQVAALQRKLNGSF